VCRFLNIQQVLKVLVLLSQESRKEIPFYNSEKRKGLSCPYLDKRWGRKEMRLYPYFKETLFLL
jgi:hypothetical protein